MSGKSPPRFRVTSTQPPPGGRTVADELMGVPGSQPEPEPPETVAPPRAPDPVLVPHRRAGQRPRLVPVPESQDGPPESVLRAWESARTEPQMWETFSVRIPTEYREMLELRTLADRRATRNRRLRRNHYLEAALGALPADPAQAAAWVRKQRKGEGIRPQAPPASGYRLHGDTVAKLRDLAEVIGQEEGNIRMWEVTTAAVWRFLSSLAGEAA